MKVHHLSAALPILMLAAVVAAGAVLARQAAAQTAGQGAAPAPVQPAAGMPQTGGIATAEQVAAAQAAWAKTRHANTYDRGMGANTTCASCKSPQNWDPTQVEAAEAAHDCASCKREPGQPRPDLPGGVAVPQDQWKNIACSVCHEPIGNSYRTAVSFWNQQKGAYEPVANTTELCGKCHEGKHGFEVIYEQTNSPAHKGWDCTRCHGSHGTPVKCTDCHDVTKGRGAADHARHPHVNCTACHDAGGLPIWLDALPDSRHFGEYIPERFAHTLRSWPSHNIQTVVDCRRCHHPQGDVLPVQPAGSDAEKLPAVRPAISSSVTCGDPVCHPNGASFQWCPILPRTSDVRSPSAMRTPAAVQVPAAATKLAAGTGAANAVDGGQTGVPATPHPALQIAPQEPGQQTAPSTPHPAVQLAPQGTAQPAGAQPAGTPSAGTPAGQATALRVQATAPAARPAQDAGPSQSLQVVIALPGEGESYYTTDWNSNVTKVPVVGRVSSSDFDASEISLRVEAVAGGKVVSAIEAEPDADGNFQVKATTNDFGEGKLASAETTCFWCHGITSLVLPRGAATIRVTAIEPTGRTASAERHVFMDQSTQANVPVRVKVQGQPDRMVRGLVISATTSLYDWRAREYTAFTGAGGQASLDVEALAQYSTPYRLEVGPEPIDGVRYVTAGPAEFEVPAGAKSAGPVELVVQPELGMLSGTLMAGKSAAAGPAAALTVRAVALPSGRSYAVAAQDGRFTLDGLELWPYLVAVDPEQAAELGLAPAAARVDLSRGQAAAEVTLSIGAATGRPAAQASGALRDAATGEPLPFGWVSGGGLAAAGLVRPDTGAYTLYGLAAGTRTVTVGAPGYYSREVPARSGLDVRLDRRPGTGTRPWGTGQVVIPEDTVATVSNDRITLQLGWLWGSGDRALTIDTPEAQIDVDSGRFALEYIPGESAWLFVLAGSASISGRAGDVTVEAGQMCAFAGQDVKSAEVVPLDAAALHVLRAGTPVSATFTPRPGFSTRIQTALASLGLMELSPAAGVAAIGLGVIAVGTVVFVRRRGRRI